MPALRIPTLMGTYDFTAPLKDGSLTSPLFEFDFGGIDLAHDGFKPLVRDGAFDIAECALVTFLQAKALGKPLVLLPLVMSARFQHDGVVYPLAAGPLQPRDLEGRVVGIRSYTQTTATWIRGILQNDFGVALDRVDWLTFEDAHVAEFRDPACARRAAPGLSLDQLLLSGGVDAAFMGREMPAAGDFARMFPAASAALDWYARTGVVPVNHVLVASERLTRERPDVVAEAYRLVAQARAQNGGLRALDVAVANDSFEAMRPALTLAIEYCSQQGLLARSLQVDELVDRQTLAFGATGFPRRS